MKGRAMASAHSTVVIIGAGFGGLAMALELRRAGIDSFTILEKATEVGGVWRENTYPGAGCDIPSPLYSFSSEPNPLWPKRFAKQPDIHDYLRSVVERRDIGSHIRFGTEVIDAEFDEAKNQWLVRTTTGETLAADVLVPAVGQLSRPALPDIAGIERFRGVAFHSAQWRHDSTVSGKRVAVIGTGASAIQFVPAIAPSIDHLTLFQRSAAWVFPKPDVDYRPWRHRLFRLFPAALKAERLAIWLLCEVMSLALVDIPALRPLLARIAQRHLHTQVADEELRAKLSPDYAPGCKRGLFSNDYFPALTRDNVRVVTESITEVTENGVRTADGVEHEVDVIVYGTGFKASEFLAPMRIHGRGGRKLSDVWAEGARAYLGMAVPDFPDMFLMYGPNTNLGVGSIVYMLESQARYIVQAVRSRASAGSLDVRSDVDRRYDRNLQRRLDRSVWTTCSSWYRNAAGRIVNNWPGTVSGYRVRTKRFRLADYRTTSGGPR
jgi:cation diffusion facilitator CzcD-associated flavoprotein CzcO